MKIDAIFAPTIICRQRICHPDIKAISHDIRDTLNLLSKLSKESERTENAPEHPMVSIRWRRKETVQVTAFRSYVVDMPLSRDRVPCRRFRLLKASSRIQTRDVPMNESGMSEVCRPLSTPQLGCGASSRLRGSHTADTEPSRWPWHCR